LVVASLLAKTPRSRDRAAAPLAYLVLPITRSRRLAGRACHFPPCTVARKTELNGVEEILIAERLGQELDGTSLHRLHGHWDVAMPGDEDDRNLPLCCGELALKIEAALAKHSDVEHQAGGAIRRSDLRKSEMEANS
jgi:hypothetical protein